MKEKQKKSKQPLEPAETEPQVDKHPPAKHPTLSKSPILQPSSNADDLNPDPPSTTQEKKIEHKTSIKEKIPKKVKTSESTTEPTVNPSKAPSNPAKPSLEEKPGEVFESDSSKGSSQKSTPKPAILKKSQKSPSLREKLSNDIAKAEAFESKSPLNPPNPPNPQNPDKTSTQESKLKDLKREKLENRFKKGKNLDSSPTPNKLDDFQDKLEEVEEHYQGIKQEFDILKAGLQDDHLDHHNLSSNDPDQSIKLIEDRIKETESDKNKVEVLLQQVKSSIEGIQSLEQYSDKHRKPNFECKNQPVEAYEELKHKSDLTAERLKKFREDQRKREILLKKELERINKKLEKEKKILSEEQTKLEEAKHEEYKQDLEKMREKKEKRKQELEEIKRRQQELEAVKHSTPMYKKIEEKYKKNLKKEEEFYSQQKDKRKKSPINIMDLAEHAKWYDNVKKEHNDKAREKGMGEKTRSASYGLTTAWTHKVLEEDQRLKRELNRASQERLNMIEKKTKYAELVKEMFMPTMDRLKKQEQGFYKSPAREKPKGATSRSPLREDKFAYGSDGEVKVQKRKWKENPMVPKPTAKKQPVVVDYLNEKRNARQEEVQEALNMDWEQELGKEHTTAELTKVLRKKAKMLEKKARKQEMMLSGNPTDGKALRYNEEVNDMLLSSIKAKLAALESRANV